jgi:hypothetical protein
MKFLNRPFPTEAAFALTTLLAVSVSKVDNDGTIPLTIRGRKLDAFRRRERKSGGGSIGRS